MIDSGVNSPASVVFQTSYTGGAPGTPTYLWEDAGVPGAHSFQFINPTTAGSQRVRVTNANFEDNESIVRCKVTDALGNFAYTPNVSVTYFRTGGP